MPARQVAASARTATGGGTGRLRDGRAGRAPAGGKREERSEAAGGEAAGPGLGGARATRACCETGEVTKRRGGRLGGARRPPGGRDARARGDAVVVTFAFGSDTARVGAAGRAGSSEGMSALSFPPSPAARLLRNPGEMGALLPGPPSLGVSGVPSLAPRGLPLPGPAAGASRRRGWPARGDTHAIRSRACRSCCCCCCGVRAEMFGDIPQAAGHRCGTHLGGVHLKPRQWIWTVQIWSLDLR